MVVVVVGVGVAKIIIVKKNMASSEMRNELVGHATLAVLALLGMALYSSTYALVYAAASSPPVVVCVCVVLLLLLLLLLT